ncbi:AAA family ATPase [Epilithonimonas hungarica]|nr:AAA family ATPase [Epilithonimonas hungarica]
MDNEVLLNPIDLAAYGWNKSDSIIITAEAKAAARLTANSSIPQGNVSLGQLLLESIGASVADKITIDSVSVQSAERIVFAVIGGETNHQESHSSTFSRLFGNGENNIPRMVSTPDLKTVSNRTFINGNQIEYGGFRLRVIETAPEGAVTVNSKTAITVINPQDKKTSYHDIGGLSTEIARIREMVELPLLHPEIFSRLGVDAPRGLLLYGPPGSGKTLIARAIAQQTNAQFLNINGPEIIQKHYGESEEMLRKVFEEAAKYPASILFIDEIDALAPNRETVLGELEKRVVGQLLALMDGVTSRGRMFVMGATNLPNNVDPALRRPGRLDREIPINPPTKAGRLEILKIHTRFMPLAADANLERVAAVTHGFLGADLAALCREAGMACAREAGTGIQQKPLFVHFNHFLTALSDFRLSTMRELSTEITETRWEDIGGLEEQKQQLKEALDWPLIYGSRFEYANAYAPKGILLTGESGTGKTLLAQAVGSTTEVNFIVARGPELLSKWVGESERGIREVFRRARQSAPSIIFFDEIDAITPKRGNSTGDGQIGDRMVGQFLLELDALDRNSGVVVLAATNRPDILDSALLRPGRFDLIVNLPKPDRETRLSVLKVHSLQSPLNDDVDLVKLAEETDGLNGAELAALCQQAKMLAIRSSVEKQPGESFTPFTIGAGHFESALAIIRRSQTIDKK